MGMNDKSDHDLLIEVHTIVVNLAKSTKSLISDHETRIRTVESDTQQIKGGQQIIQRIFSAASVIGILASAFIAWISYKK